MSCFVDLFSKKLWGRLEESEMRIGWIQTKWVEMSGLVATSFKPLITLSSVNYAWFQGERGSNLLGNKSTSKRSPHRCLALSQ